MANNDDLQIASEQLAARVSLRDVLNMPSTLSKEDRLVIVEQAFVMLELSYIHLPQKRAMYAVDPIQRLRLLKYRIEQMREENLPDPIFFHNEMIEIFTQVRDLHTNYILPEPYRSLTAYLPFFLEEYFEGNGDSHFIVTWVDPDSTHDPEFKKGVEILYWNGVPIKRAVELNAARQAGGNPDARFQRGLSAMTIRPLMRILPPDEDWVRLRYRALEDDGGGEHDVEYVWYASTQPPNASAEEQARGTGEALAFGFDIQWAKTQEIKKNLIAPQLALIQEQLVAEQIVVKAPGSDLMTMLPTIFRAGTKETNSGTFGYIRIFSFMYEDADVFVSEFRELIEQLPQEGLILDVRANGGGNILACERLLQLLTPNEIEPARFQFINSPLTLALSQRYADLVEWAPYIARSVETGAVESLGFPITSKESCNNIGQVYPGPVVLITDALCYSATDIFAAAFQDHNIGKILGVSGNTGAGGANVWTHNSFVSLTARLSEKHPMRNVFKTLPQGAGMRVAIRRCLRVGKNAGIPVEDLGVVPDKMHPMSRRDLLEGNADLLEEAGKILSGQ